MSGLGARSLGGPATPYYGLCAWVGCAVRTNQVSRS